jgi:hypothetical protein
MRYSFLPEEPFLDFDCSSYHDLFRDINDFVQDSCGDGDSESEEDFSVDFEVIIHFSFF